MKELELHFELSQVLPTEQIEHITGLIGNLDPNKTVRTTDETIVALREYIWTVTLDRVAISRHLNAGHVDDFNDLDKLRTLITHNYKEDVEAVIYKLFSYIFILKSERFFDSLSLTSLSQQGYTPKIPLRVFVEKKLSFDIDHIDFFEPNSWAFDPRFASFSK